MDQKIQLMHPAGKKAVSIDTGKYNVLKEFILDYLKSNGESTHEEIFRALKADFKKSKTRFEGSVEWYMEWVKLDLEARKQIKRSSNITPIKFILA
jgi:hypothetical protein